MRRPERTRARIRAIPRPLALLLPLVALFGVIWGLTTPAWQAPDEIQHYAYVEALGEFGQLPGRPDRAQVSDAVGSSLRLTNADPVVIFPFAKPEWSAASERRWREEAERARSDDGGGISPASTYPPAYYVFETPVYLAAKNGTVLDRLYLMRMVSSLWLLVATLGAWLLAGQLFGRRRPLQLVAAATVGLWPMLASISASVSPDALLYALWSLAMWLGVAILKEGMTLPRGIGFGTVVGIALITKATSLALVPAALFVVAVAAWRARDRIVRVLLPGTALALLGMAVPTIIWTAVTRAAGRAAYAQASGAGAGLAEPLNVREFGSYLWQFYLPKLPFQQDIAFLYPVISDFPLFNTWLGMSWGVFGWINVWFPRWVYEIFAAVTALLAVGALVTIVRAVRRHRRARALLAWSAVPVFLLMITGALLAGIHWSDFRYYDTGGPPFAQGRYLFPLCALGGAVVAAAVSALPRRLQTVGGGVWLGGLLGLQATCLALVFVRFYAV